MKKIIFILLSTVLVSVAATVFSLVTALPLLTLVRFGLLSTDPVQVVMALVNNAPSTQILDWTIILAQTVLTLGAQIVLFLFLRQVVRTFASFNDYFKGLYTIFFFLILLVPVALVYLFIFISFPLGIFLALVGGFFALVAFGITIILKKVLPQTNVEENRNILF